MSKKLMLVAASGGILIGLIKLASKFTAYKIAANNVKSFISPKNFILEIDQKILKHAILDGIPIKWSDKESKSYEVIWTDSDLKITKLFDKKFYNREKVSKRTFVIPIKIFKCVIVADNNSYSNILEYPKDYFKESEILFSASIIEYGIHFFVNVNYCKYENVERITLYYFFEDGTFSKEILGKNLKGKIRRMKSGMCCAEIKFLTFGFCNFFVGWILENEIFCETKKYIL